MIDRKHIKRGAIWYADLPETEIGSVQAGKRPVLITQTDRLNKNSPTVLVAIITSKIKRPYDPVHVVLPRIKGLPKQSMVEAEQRKTISITQLTEYRCTLDPVTMKKVSKALRASERPQSPKPRHPKKCKSRINGKHKKTNHYQK